MVRSRRPSPTTVKPMTEPAEKAILRPRLRLSEAPWAVRALAPVAVRIPTKPERAEKIIGGIKGQSSFGYLSAVVLPNLFKESKKRKYKLRDKPENIANFISAAYTGIEMNCILTACYKAPMGAHCKPGPLFDTLARSIICLCGGEEK